MGHQQIHEDLMYLAGRLLHRSAQTEAERQAAGYIHKRLEEYSPNVQLDEFHTIENYPYLFASYYSEFLVVAVLAQWWPVFASAYSLVVLGCYLAEFMGYRLFARLMPQFDSQNVIARFLGLRPRKLLIVTAHYDSGSANALTRPAILPWLRPMHFLLIACMVVVVATCIVDSAGWWNNQVFPATAPLRWSAATVLVACSLVLFYVSARGDDIRGAVFNASGVAALLRLGERLQAEPIEDADVWLVATGSHEAWMSGMRHLFTAHPLDKGQTLVINLEGVGAGRLSYLTAEGMLRAEGPGKPLLAAARAVADRQPQPVPPARFHTVPTAAHIPLARGFQAMTLIGLDERGLPPHWNQPTDRVTEVDEASVAQAATFAEDLLRELAKP